MYRLFTLGRFEVRADDTLTSSVASTQPKRLVLLAYLAAATPHGFRRRDTLLGLFWPELGQTEARRALRQALYHLRQVVGADAIITRSDDQVALEPTQIWCDVVALEGALDSGDSAGALALYQGDFLAGVYIPDAAAELEEWVDRTRSRLRSRVVDAAWQLAERESARGNAGLAARAAERAHDLTPDDEAGLRRLIELLGNSGRPGDAQNAYDRFKRRLAQEFESEPDQTTTALIAKIRSEPGVVRSLTRSDAASVGGGDGGTDVSTSASPSRNGGMAAASIHPPTPAATEAATGDMVSGPVAPQPPLPTQDSQRAPQPPRSPPSRSVSRLRRPLFVGITLSILFVAALLTWLLAATQPTLLSEGVVSPRDRILVADFVNRTRDSTLAATLAEALRVDLGQSPLVRVMTTSQVHAALRRMEQPLQISVDDSVARSIALREGVKAFVTGEVSVVGTRYLLTARIVAAPTGDELASVRETADDSTQLIAAIDALSAQLRRRLGESLRSLAAEPPLRQVTTGSLEALRLYSRAMAVNDFGGDRDAITALLGDAITIDTGFATAYRMLGATYAAIGEPGKAEAAMERAIALRDRLPFRDRYLTMGSYYRNITGEFGKAASAYSALLELYPTDVAGLNNLGLVYSEQRRYAQAETLFRQLTTIDSTLPSVHIALAEMLALQGRFDESGVVLDGVRQRFPSYTITDLTETYVAVARQDWSAAERHILRRLERATGNASTEASALLTLGQIELVMGRLADAERDLRASMVLSKRVESPSRYTAAAIALSWLELRYRERPAVARALVEAALAVYPLDSLAPADRQYAALGELYAELGDTARAARLLVAVSRDPVALRSLGSAGLHTLRGSVAMAEGRGRDAVQEFGNAEVVDPCPVCALPALARAQELTGDSNAAIKTYEQYLNTPWVWRFETDAPHLAWSIRRLAALYEARGDMVRAADQYAKLRTLYGDAEREMAAALGDARRNEERLRVGRPR